MRGYSGQPTKREIRSWARRIREDLRDLEAAVTADRPSDALAAAEDLTGSAGELATAVEGRYAVRPSFASGD